MTQGDYRRALAKVLTTEAPRLVHDPAILAVMSELLHDQIIAQAGGSGTNRPKLLDLPKDDGTRYTLRVPRILKADTPNQKVGFIPYGTVGAQTCPTSCPLMGNGCYAEAGPLMIHWRNVTGGKGLTLAEFCEALQGLPRFQLWRHGQAGDLPGIDKRINPKALAAITAAQHGRRGFAYTHKPLTAANRRHIEAANAGGFAVNVSANGPKDVDRILATGIKAPVVTMLKKAAPKVTMTAGGARVVRCPAYNDDKTTCATCGLCAIRDRDYVIGFPAHGSRWKKAEAIVDKNT